jgi:D-glycero-alpha-D-manno-heptose-7-phosphate kinase
MIISKTPFRVSLAGGGSDFPEYYRHRPGRVVSLALNRYMYVTVNRRFDDTIRVSYTRTEIVERLDDLKHDLIREALRMTGIRSGIEITTIADLPAGIGLGSSSALAVGVLHALYAYKGEWQAPDSLASRACQIEIETLGRPIGKQDQYIAAFGGMHEFQFNPDHTVRVHPMVCTKSTRRRLEQRLLLFFTGTVRSAASVLHEARGRLENGHDARTNVDELVDIAGDVRRCLISGRLDRIGSLLDRSWQTKKRMASGVSNRHLDGLYARAIRAGADGGKVSGAGGGGCLLLFVRPAVREKVRMSMTRAGLREVPLGIEPEGSRIIHYS